MSCFYHDITSVLASQHYENLWKTDRCPAILKEKPIKFAHVHIIQSFSLRKFTFSMYNR